MNATQFNIVAVVLILIGLPMVVGAITSTGGDGVSKDWRNAYSTDYSGQVAYAQWVENGQDYSLTYEQIQAGYGNCSFIAPDLYSLGGLTGDCQGEGSFFAYGFDFFGSTVATTNTGEPAISVPVDHNNLNPGDYIGTSGKGPFTWTFAQANSGVIGNEEMPEAFRWIFIEPSASYNCASSAFKNITFDATVRVVEVDFINGTFQEHLKITKSFASSNQLLWDVYDPQHGWITGCFLGMTVEIDLDGFEQTILNNEVGSWQSTYLQLTLDEFQVDEPGQPSNIGQTQLPWHGDTGSFLIVHEYSTVDVASVNFFIRGGTLLLAIGVGTLALASTPYWDPLRAWFRGAI